MLQSPTLKFLSELKKNNNKPWFDAHRKQYDAAREDFVSFIQNVINSFAKKEPALAHLKAKDCMFRINRDVRFSKDKSPYKTNFGAYINAEGKKSWKAGYYFHFEPGNSFRGGGMWMPEPVQLAKVRQEIDYNLADFKKIITSKKFKDTYGSLSSDKEYMLSRVPKGFEADNPAAEYLKFKSFVATAFVSDSDLTDKNLTSKTVKAYETLQPLVAFLNEATV
ncbi:MAG: TIGR02453 family protein [Niabella sp. SCN 42-15]|nr:MAG: TIGR02453 family protein [Niabella sp. SCN 42-15]